MRREPDYGESMFRAAATVRSVLLTACLLFGGCPEQKTPSEPASPEPLQWHLPGPAIDAGAVFSVWGPSGSDLWAVGGERGKPLVLRFDGQAWRYDAPPAGQQLWWVHGSEDSVVVVGDASAAYVHRDDSWTHIPGGPAGTTLYGVWLSGPNDGWAVGGPFDAAPEGTALEGDVVLRFNGTSFQRQSIPILEGRTGQKRLFKVWGSAPDDVWIVGSNGFIMRYDGNAWSQMDSGTSAMLFTITGRASDDVWAVGGGAKAVLLHYDGSGWRSQELPEFAPQILQGVWTAPGQPVWVSGFFGFTAMLEDGVWEEPDSGVIDPLHAVFRDGAGRVWAVGGDIAAAKSNYTGVVAVTDPKVPAVPADPSGPTEDAETPPDSSADANDAAPLDASPPDGGSDASTLDGMPDAGPLPCGGLATTCPPELPHHGAPCSGALECPYPVANDPLDTVHTATCNADGRFTITTDCGPILGGSCAIPPLTEACLDPFEGQLGGATVAAGPVTDGTFEAFSPGDSAPVVWGGQGSPMLAFRLSITDADEVTCANVRTQIAIDGVDTVDATQPVVFRCGETLLIYVILPASPLDCEERLFELDVKVDVPGVGSTEATLNVQGGQNCFG